MIIGWGMGCEIEEKSLGVRLVMGNSDDLFSSRDLVPGEDIQLKPRVDVVKFYNP